MSSEMEYENGIEGEIAAAARAVCGHLIAPCRIQFPLRAGQSHSGMLRQLHEAVALNLAVRGLLWAM